MSVRRSSIPILFAAVALAACTESASGPASSLGPSFARDGEGRPTVLVNPKGEANGTATTIAEGIAMVARGGRVMVLPGTYAEVLVIDKGVTLEGIGGNSGDVIIDVADPAQRPPIAVHVVTADPVTIRNITVTVRGATGIFGDGARAAVNLTLEQVTVVAVSPPLGAGNLVVVTNELPVTGQRARFEMRESHVDGGVTEAMNLTPPFAQSFGIHPYGDVDAVIVGNTVRRTGGACIWAQIRNDLGGDTRAEIVDNDVDECYPIGRAAAILVGSGAAFAVTPTRPATATGIVNIVGNRIRNTTRSCYTGTGINFEYLGGLVERNSIVDVVQTCTPATGTLRNLPAAIWVGSTPARGFPAATPIVRYNDLQCNAYAALRVGPNQTTPIDATQNWWGSPTGPSSVGAATGRDALVVEAGAATPLYQPFAGAPVLGMIPPC